jgi:hypothetical protein
METIWERGFGRKVGIGRGRLVKLFECVGTGFVY